MSKANQAFLLMVLCGIWTELAVSNKQLIPTLFANVLMVVFMFRGIGLGIESKAEEDSK